MITAVADTTVIIMFFSSFMNMLPGYENVFDYSLGNPSVPCPERFTAAMQELLAQEDPVALHGYCPSPVSYTHLDVYKRQP